MGPMSALSGKIPIKSKPTKSPRRISHPNETPEKYVTKDFAIRLLTRRKLSKPVASVIEGLHVSGETWVSSQEIYEASGYHSA